MWKFIKAFFRVTFKIVLVLILLAGWALAGASLYLVRTAGDWPYIGRLHLVPKAKLTYYDTWVDLSRWKSADDSKPHEAIAEQLVHSGREDLLKLVGKPVTPEPKPVPTTQQVKRPVFTPPEAQPGSTPPWDPTYVPPPEDPEVRKPTQTEEPPLKVPHGKSIFDR